jgi:CHU_C Type IX secretion signal domain
LGNFNYTFTNLGYYYLNLQVSNYLGCSDDTCIRIHVANPVANFSGPDTISCPGIFDTLTNLSNGAYDKVVITVSSPPINYFASFQYSINDPNGIPKKMGIPIGYPGDYVICWKITSINGCVDSICKNLHVNGPLGSLTCSNVFGCRGKPICCTLNTNSIANPLIKYPDGAFQILPYSSSNNYPFCHSYAVIGHQLVQAFIDDGLGCSYPLTDTVHIDGVIANFNWSPHIIDFCVRADVTMNDLTIKGLYNLDTANYKWIIKNSSGNVYAIYHHQNPHIIITTPGTYSMMLIAKSLYGCIDTIEKPFVRVHPKPLSQFISSPDTICINDCVTFTNTSVNFDSVKSYTWYFDWANTTPKSNAFNTNYCFVTPGNYQVVLLDSTIYNCVDTSNKHIIVVLSGIQISFTKDKDTVCANVTTVHFNSTTTPSINVQQKWFFGDGSSTPLGNFPQATHSYVLPPNVTDTCYNIMLIVKTISGCADTLVQQVCLAEVPQPQLIHGNANACEPLKTFFTINNLNSVPISNYQINYGDGSIAYNSNIAPINLPKVYHNVSHQTVANYTATIQVTSNYNCKATIFDSFKVNPLPVACVGNNDSICPGIPAIIGCPPFPDYQYHWFRPAVLGTFKPNSFIADPHIKIYQTDSFALAVSNQFGCTDTNKIVVHIRPYIVPTFGHDTTICLGDTIHLYASGGVNYQWKNLMTNQIVSYQSNVFIPVFDSTNFQLIIDGKCNADSTSIVHINIFQPKPFVVINPNTATILAGQSYTIKPTTNAAFVKWHPNYFIDCDTCINVKVSPDVNTIYHVLTNDLHGCMDSSEVTIKVLCDKSNSIFIPNGFEPKVNAKYENRFFYVQGKGIKEIEFMRIYDRWGSEVFSAEHSPINKPDAGWDGNFRGKPCTCDIYMYQMQVICADGTIFPISGNMTLIR